MQNNINLLPLTLYTQNNLFVNYIIYSYLSVCKIFSKLQNMIRQV